MLWAVMLTAFYGFLRVSEYTAFRIGAATTAAAAGFPRWLIQALGRWTSNCYREYIRIPPQTLQDVSTSLAKIYPNPQVPFDPDHVS